MSDGDGPQPTESKPIALAYETPKKKPTQPIDFGSLWLGSATTHFIIQVIGQSAGESALVSFGSPILIYLLASWHFFAVTRNLHQRVAIPLALLNSALWGLVIACLIRLWQRWRKREA